MTRRDPNTLDLIHQPIRIAEDVKVWPVRERGELVYRLEIPKLHRFFRVGYEEYVFISLLDGTTSIPQACGLAAAKLGARAPSAVQAGAIARWLLQHELAYLVADGAPQRRRSVTDGNSKRSPLSRFLARLNPFWMKLPMPQIQTWINSIAGILRFLLAPHAVCIGFGLILVSSIVLFARWSEFASSAVSLFHPGNWIWVFGTWIVLKMVHEVAHAIACHRQGGSVQETGVVFVLFAPLAYVDVTSCWRMNSRLSRIIVSAAGMYVELLIAALAVIGWTLIDHPHVRFLLHNLVVTAGLSTLLFNANVLMRFDGYFILADLIDVPNLYAEASSAVRRLATRIITGRKDAGAGLVGWRGCFVLSYGIAALIWRVVVCASLAIAASAMFAGSGIVIATLGVAMWIGLPLQQLMRFAKELRISDPHRFFRATITGTLMFVAFFGTFVGLPLPTSIAVPAISRYVPESLVRSRASGFVTKVHVTDGEVVQAGDILVELENRDLTSRLRQLELRAEQNEMRLRRAVDQHDAGERHVLMENQRSIVEQIEQLNTQVAGLRVIAPRSGRVVARELEAREGTYVREGDAIAIVASDGDKEIVALIDQDVVEQVRALVGERIRVRTASFAVANGTLDRVEPRADERLLEPALSATEGGSLAVQAASDEEDQAELRLLSPHFRGRIGLTHDVAKNVPAGIRMRAWLGYRCEPLAVRLHHAIRRAWIRVQEERETLSQ